MKQILSRLVEREELTRQETHDIMINITKEVYPNEQIAALLMSLQLRGITSEELLGFRDGLLETGRHVDFSPYKVLDIVGTGGDGKNTFNISTCASFVVAGAGYKVAKHGNYAATSNSGASNVIENHGIRFANDEDKLKRSIEECGIAYLHAPLFAEGMKYVAPVRKALGIPTCFNLLGPLVNPARPSYQLLGVANLSQMRLYTNTLQKTDINYGIVNSTDGYDEISLTSGFKVMTRHMEKVLSPADISLNDNNPHELFGGDTKEEAVKIFDAVLDCTSTESQKNVVLINATFGIQIIEPEKSIQECLAIARESLDSKRAKHTFEKFVELNS